MGRPLLVPHPEGYQQCWSNIKGERRKSTNGSATEDLREKKVGEQIIRVVVADTRGGFLVGFPFVNPQTIFSFEI